jgi:glycosyltransferase involved in cell wall biosynthesis
VLLARGGVEAHGGEVLHHASQLGLRVTDVAVEPSGKQVPAQYAAAFAAAEPADVMNVTTPIPHNVLRALYRAADGVMANSGREPFGLVGLEAMAAGGAAYTGNTGEEYVRHLQNAIVLDTNEPEEAAWYVDYLADSPRQAQAIRDQARSDAAQFAWDHVLNDLLAKVAFLAARYGARLMRPVTSAGNALEAPE